MTSVYGDLILQDGAKVIDKSGNRFGSPTKRFFNATVRVATSETGPSIRTQIVPCSSITHGGKIVINVYPFFMVGGAELTNVLLAINGIPSDLVSTKPIMGTGFIVTTDPSGKAMSSSGLTWSTAQNTQIISNKFITADTLTTLNFSQFSLVYDL
ncbi:hypothetical protein ACTFIY_004576 [Dictyostelium cf. discoideum]